MSSDDKRRLRTRDLPHPPKRLRAGETGRPRNDFKANHTERTTKRMPGTNGSWPAASLAEGQPPRPPAIGMLFEDLAEGLEPAPVFGQYPKGLIKKLLPWMRCERKEILRVCSGSLRKGEGIRVDIRPEARPDFVADGRRLPFADGAIKAVMLDPPYTEQYARDLYGTDYPQPSDLLREAMRVVRPGGAVVFVHTLVPIPPRGLRVEKTFGLSTGMGFHMRAVTVMYKQTELQLGLDLETAV